MNINKLTGLVLLLLVAISIAFAESPGQNDNSTTLGKAFPYPIEGMDAAELIEALSEIQSIIPDGEKDKIIGVTVKDSASVEISTGIKFGPKAGHGRKLFFQKNDGKWTLIKELLWKS